MVVANRRCLIDRLGQDEDAIIRNRARRVDDERAGELRVETRAHKSMLMGLKRKRHVALPFSQRRPVLVGSRLPASERDVTRRPRQQDERIDCRTVLAESADDERIVGRIPNHYVNRCAGPHPEQRCGNCGRLSFFGERRDGQGWIGVSQQVPCDCREREPEDERVTDISAGRRAIVIRRDALRRGSWRNSGDRVCGRRYGQGRSNDGRCSNCQ